MKEKTERLRKYLQNGDYPKIANMAGVSLQTLRKALQRESPEELRPCELIAYNQFLSYVEDKKNELNSLNEKLNQLS
jgi:hypothetical protein